MSWIERTNTEFIITCGNGRAFKPLYLNTQKTVEYNVSEFDFPELSGTLVKRSKPRGTRYNLEIYFQGEDNIEKSEAFESAASDSRPWTISHPLYGEITVQPLSLLFDNSSYNVSKISGVVVQTITDEAPKGSIDPTNKIAQDFETTNEAISQSVANEVIPVSAGVTLEDNAYKLYTTSTDTVKDAEQAEEYTNIFNKANAAILDVTSEPLAAARALQALIGAPALFKTSVKERLKLLKNQFDLLRTTFSAIEERVDKLIYENNQGALISAMVLTISTPLPTDFGTGTEIVSAIDDVYNYYEQYLQDIDSLQSDNGGSLDSFCPNPTAQYQLNNLVNFGLSSLFSIVIGAKQERIIYLEEDSNLILLTHRFLGLEPDDSTIDTFIKNNNIGLNEFLQIRKGRKISYYI